MKRDKKKFHKQDSGSSEDNSSSSEDDENAELLTEELEEGFFKVLSQLKKKDSKLYEENVRFFTGNTLVGDSQSNKNKGDQEKIKKSRKKYIRWLKGQREMIGNEKVKEELEALHDFWTNPKLNKDDQFLRDYILNKKFLEPDDSFNIEEEIQKLSDEEKEVEEEIRFEHQYNCRFENPGLELVGKTKSKPKSNKKKADEEVLVHEYDDSLHNDFTLENEENCEKDTEKETSKKKKKKKRNKSSERKLELEEKEVKNSKVGKTKSKPKSKKKKADEELLVHEYDDNLHNDFTLENEENCKKDTEKETSKKKKKKERNKSSKRKLELEEKEVKNSKAEKLARREGKNNLQVENQLNSENDEDVPQSDRSIKTEKSSDAKSRKRKRNKTRSEELNQYKTLHLNKILKSKINLSENAIIDTLKSVKVVVPTNEHQPTQGKINLPRNLQMKNEMGKKKMRHRNINKDQWMNKKLSVLTDGKMKKQQTHYNGHNKSMFGAKKEKIKVKTKQNKNFQNRIVKEKKNKELKFRKMRSKKNKASNVAGKR